MSLPMSSGAYLLITLLTYTVLLLIDMFAYEFVVPELLQAAWVLITAAPLLIPMQWLVRMDPIWRKQ